MSTEKKLVESAKRIEYGYGIVDKNGQPWWDEGCVAHEPSCLRDVCADLNGGYLTSMEEGVRKPFRVVKLFWMTHRKRK